MIIANSLEPGNKRIRDYDNDMHNIGNGYMERTMYPFSILGTTNFAGTISLRNGSLTGTSIILLILILHLLYAAAVWIMEFLCVRIQNKGLPNGFTLCRRLCRITLRRPWGTVGANRCKYRCIPISGNREFSRFSIGHTGDISLHIGSECGYFCVP